MRIAIFSDVHGNPIALDAVLAAISARGGADEYLVLGDLAAAGHGPVGALQRLSEIPNARFVRGNTEAWLTTVKPAATLRDLRDLAEQRDEADRQMDKAIGEADTSPELRVEFQRVAYDISAVLEAQRASGHPTAEGLAENFHGKRVPPWLRG